MSENTESFNHSESHNYTEEILQEISAKNNFKTSFSRNGEVILGCLIITISIIGK